MQFRRSITILLGAGALVLTSACSSSSTDAGGSPAKEAKAASPSAGARGGTGSGELQARWWRWTEAAPENANPIDDEDGHLCGDNQASDVWFLAGTHGGAARRTCRMPSGIPVAFPLVNRITSPKSACDAFLAGAKGSATLDGKPVTSQRLDAAPVEGWGSGAMACGLWVRLDPLSPGSHTLSFQGSSGDFSTSVDYRLDAGTR
ncbi:signal protein [Streptomyces griseocarneus]|uniref:signal protein n=1 Tax=Streptomyces griseocarneus TaxID=51201 RepID=UPI00167DA4C1|nr:signal protein [Streptomyces griseocarneus]MBZ6477212.1 signal protein [Streptomyces griseocarneus]GHG54092.1 hypothetical protein GCM10018779_16730 [Streptomyces griseocarneus]